MPATVLSQKWPCSLPSLPTYSTGMAALLGLAVPGASCPVANSVTVEVESVENHREIDSVIAPAVKPAGGLTELWLLVWKYADEPVQPTLAVAELPLPVESGTTVPEVWLRRHQAVGRLLAESLRRVWEVMLPAGS